MQNRASEIEKKISDDNKKCYIVKRNIQHSVMGTDCNSSVSHVNVTGEYFCRENVSKTLNGNLNTFLTVEFNVSLYCLIFLLSVGGNALVILTLFREKKMRTVTNLFLLNLAVSDLMLSMLCMPFSLVATIILRNFIFGKAMCVIIRYFQGKYMVKDLCSLQL